MAHVSGSPQTPKTSKKPLTKTVDMISAEATEAYLSSIADDSDVSLVEIREYLVDEIGTCIDMENALRGKTRARLPQIQSLACPEVVSVILARARVARVSLTGRRVEGEFDLLCTYVESGPQAGTYVETEDELLRMIAQLSPRMNGGAIKDVLRLLRTRAPMVPVERSAHLVPVNNGVFNHLTKELEPHSPDRVFLMKSPVDYVVGAQNPVIDNPDGTQWDVESWVAELHDDPQVVQVYWQLLSAVVRSNVAWDKAAFLYSPYGSNGKGSIAALMRELVGEDHAASIQLNEFGDRFALGLLTRARAIIVDENDVGGYSERSSKFKAVVTGDKFSIERKHRDPGDISFRGMVVQCINDFPRAKDKSDSFARRQLFVPFDKRFEGVERKYIKNDYLRRREVLEYVLKRVLDMDHQELSEPGACKRLKDEYRRDNDSVRDFWAEFEDEFTWDLLPTSFLYDLYKSWFSRNNPRGGALSNRSFTQSLRQMLEGSTQWDFSDVQRKHRPSGTRMAEPEHLIHFYDLKDWGNSSYTGTDVDKRCVQQPLAANYRGVLRISNSAAAVQTAAVDDGDID